MKKINVLLLIAIMALSSTVTASAFDWGSLLGGMLGGSSSNSESSNTGTSVISNLLMGVLQNDDLDVKDIAGTWTASGPSVQFKSENLLEQAGGVASATAIEEKIKPYYNKIGIDGMTMKITTEGEVTVTLKNGKSFSGTVTKGDTKGKMVFNFSKFSKRGVTVEVSKSGSMLSLLADVTKLQSLLGMFSEKMNNSQLSTITSLINNYDGIYVGIELTK